MESCKSGLSPFDMEMKPNWRSVLVNKHQQRLLNCGTKPFIPTVPNKAGQDTTFLPVMLEAVLFQLNPTLCNLIFPKQVYYKSFTAPVLLLQVSLASPSPKANETPSENLISSPVALVDSVFSYLKSVMWLSTQIGNPQVPETDRPKEALTPILSCLFRCHS